jgi:hypothetical protein
MKRYGLNPYGEPLWRVIWGETRFYLAGTDANSVQWLPLYGFPCWVLEKWLPAEKFAGTRQQWEMSELTSGTKLGPYPERGEYEPAHIFRNFEPTTGAIEKFMHWIQAGQNYSFAEKRAALQAEHDKRKAAQEKLIHDVYEESQGPFGHNPVAGIPSKKKPEDMKLDIGAEDLKMPMGEGKFFTGGGKA